jgi:predicted nucleic acid-binding protein
MALTAQAELAATPGISHRVKPVDLPIASIATTEDLGVLHYDHDYDTTWSTHRCRSLASRGEIG